MREEKKAGACGAASITKTLAGQYTMTDRTDDRLHTLHELGQSVWLDYIRRGILESGELERMIRDWDLRGVTSNPSIFEKAIGGSTDYDEELAALAETDPHPMAAYEAVAIQDIQDAADLFRPVYEETDGRDGFVSLEVSPDLADDTEGTIGQARRLWREVGRPNVMIKVPGTEAGLPAIQTLLSEGINVNITLLFSLASYEKVMERFQAALEERIGRAEPIDRIASVASFFISRVDTAADAEIEKRLESAPGRDAEELRGMLGKTAIANAKVAYARFQDVFSKPRFAILREAGAQVQRPLWASTSTKNPEYRDVVYVEELIGPDTVNTMPLDTLEAFADHGQAERRVDADVDEAEAHLRALKRHGIDLDAITRRLQEDGVRAFADSFEGMIGTVGEKLGEIAART